tara:strand:- start:19776 stop:20579 length:804 start_codon:yes stop_codon:yes gene_type:complete
MKPEGIARERHYSCKNLLDLTQQDYVRCDWEGLLTEARTCYGLWKAGILPMSLQAMSGKNVKEEDWDMTLSKNAYNIITLSSTMPHFYNLWMQLFKQIRSHPELKKQPLWIHAWLNVHRYEDLGKLSLGWHNHSYCRYHGFVHLSDRPTDTIFADRIPTSNEERDDITTWYLKNEDRTQHPLNDTDITLRIPNSQGLHYIGPGPLLHRVIPHPYKGWRVSIGYDIIDDLNWLAMEDCTSEMGVCQAYPVFERNVDIFNTKLVPIPLL